ncbi:MAG: glycosyltransferase [Scytonematopsis contorta HA4267-MV1]|jgi:glycosyltransferase involved in cell wall biosynthesis|nr:glycosyltransferase [Scytonematopsis contorta HA4267-MV1]
MQVLQLNLSDYSLTGGTGITMHRLHAGINKKGIESKIFCARNQSSDNSIAVQKRCYTVRAVEAVLRKLEVEFGLNDISRVISSLNIRKHEAYRTTDIINLHCIHDEFISYLALPWLTKKPTVFTIHDMWAFTGHCTSSYECERWRSGCGECPHLETPPKVKKDNTRLEWNLKNWAYSRSLLHVVTPSQWIYDLAQKSMLRRFPIHYIPHGLDTEVYYPHNKEHCRSVLGIPSGKKVLMFGTTSVKDYRKGGDLLIKALQMIPASLKSETVVITIGHGKVKSEDIGMPCFNFGYVDSDSFKAIIYAAADIFIYPTRSDSFGLVSMESLACGTPVVTFRVGGLTDTVRPNITGLLAEPENITQFRDCIVQLLEDENLRATMSEKCRQIAVKEYSLELYAQRYIDLYHQILKFSTDKNQVKSNTNN